MKIFFVALFVLVVSQKSFSDELVANCKGMNSKSDGNFQLLKKRDLPSHYLLLRDSLMPGGFFRYEVEMFENKESICVYADDYVYGSTVKLPIQIFCLPVGSRQEVINAKGYYTCDVRKPLE